MADLYDRIFSRNPDAELTTSGDQLSVHSLTAALNLVARGVFTATQAKNFMILDAAAAADFDALVALVTAASGTAAKYAILANLEAAGIAVSMGAITTKAAYKTAAGIT